MVNKFNLSARCAGRVVRRAAVNRSIPAASERIRANSICCAVQHRVIVAESKRIFRAALPAPQSPLQPAPGHAVPTRRELSARRVTLTEADCGRRRLCAAAKPHTRPTTSLFLVRPVRQAAGLEPRQARHRARSAARIAAAIGKAGSPKRSSAPMRCCGFPPTTGSASSRRPTPARWRWRCGRCSAPRPVTMLAWESFGEGWVTDVAKQLKLDADIRTADYGEIARS